MPQFKGVPAWTHDAATDQSYLHLFLAEQPDLNWANPTSRPRCTTTLRHWLDRGVDGFRADVVHLIGKGDRRRRPARHLVTIPLLAIDRPFGHELLRRIRSLLDSYDARADDGRRGLPAARGRRRRISATSTVAPPSCTCRSTSGPLHTPVGRRPRCTTRCRRWRPTSPSPDWPTFVLSNHDQPRHATRLRFRGPQPARRR
jgi:alpha-glucosidase